LFLYLRGNTKNVSTSDKKLLLRAARMFSVLMDYLK
jgi:hypothetical protein